MSLHRIGEYDPDYRDTIQSKDLKGMSVYTQGTNEKVGTVSDILVDEQGAFRYLVLDLGIWIFGKKVLLPIGRGQIDSSTDRVSIAITKEQAENLPEYKQGIEVDYDYEERVREVYRGQPVGRTTSRDNRNTYTYAQDQDLYDTSAHADRTIKLYEERLVTRKQRQKTGEVAIGKSIETETARVSVPIEKERVVIERVTPQDAGRVVDPGTVKFGEGEVARIEVYEETPDIHKEAFVREEIRIKKVVEQETFEAQETVRREELDIDTQGHPIVN